MEGGNGGDEVGVEVDGGGAVDMCGRGGGDGGGGRVEPGATLGHTPAVRITDMMVAKLARRLSTPSTTPLPHGSTACSDCGASWQPRLTMPEAISMNELSDRLAPASTHACSALM